MTTRLQLAAQIQAFVVAYARANPLYTFTPYDLLNTSAYLKDLKAEVWHVQSACKTLTGIGELDKVRLASGRVKFGYSLPVSKRPKDKEPKHLFTDQGHLDASRVTPPDVKIMATQRNTIIVSFRGLRIEIGAEE